MEHDKKMRTIDMNPCCMNLDSAFLSARIFRPGLVASSAGDTSSKLGNREFRGDQRQSIRMCTLFGPQFQYFHLDQSLYRSIPHSKPD